MFETLSKSENNHVLEIGFGTGKLLIGLHEKSEMEKMPLDGDVFNYYSMQDIEKLLKLQGSFDDIDIISKNGKGKTCYCVVGTKLAA